MQHAGIHKHLAGEVPRLMSEKMPIIPHKRSFWIRWQFLITLCALFALMLATRRADLYNLRLKEANVRARLLMTVEENLALRAQRDALLSDPSYVEMVARE